MVLSIVFFYLALLSFCLRVSWFTSLHSNEHRPDGKPASEMHLIDQHMLRENLLLAHRLRQFTQAVQHWTIRQTAPETGSNQQAVQHCFMLSPSGCAALLNQWWLTQSIQAAIHSALQLEQRQTWFP